jgi:hypothetical protein
MIHCGYSVVIAVHFVAYCLHVSGARTPSVGASAHLRCLPFLLLVATLVWQPHAHALLLACSALLPCCRRCIIWIAR